LQLVGENYVVVFAKEPTVIVLKEMLASEHSTAGTVVFSLQIYSICSGSGDVVVDEDRGASQRHDRRSVTVTLLVKYTTYSIAIVKKKNRIFIADH
jgi:hypothetical protein